MSNKKTVVFDFDGDCATLADKVKCFKPWNYKGVR